MAGVDIVDVDLFDPVPLIEIGEQVKGGLDGPANKQAVVLANRTFHLKTESDKIAKQVNELDAAKVGADSKGTADQIMTDHLHEADPHAQYVKVAGANLPGGVVLLDINGKIPEQFMEIFKSTYKVVQDQAERLGLPQSPDLTIVAQADDNNMYYLNGGLDPATAENWTKGQSATVAGVVKVFGRTGDVTAQAGDYNADQITETPDRVFLSPSEKVAFGLKQPKLVSGVSLKTISGYTLLDEGDLRLTLADIDASSDRAFVSPSEKASYAAKQEQLQSGTNIKTLHGKTLLGSGDVTLTANDVGADPKGAATSEVAAHEAKTDPHTQYLTQNRGDARYIQSSNVNKPNGMLQLDSNNKIPSGYIDVLQARHVIVQDDAERLALPVYNNLTIAAQLNGPGDDDDRMYYLNGGLDPSVESNWHKGQSAVLQGVPSVFGRTGAITAQVGDYTTDQITETSNKMFVTPTEKTAWDDKQEPLVSGTNIRTLGGKSLLGSGDIPITAGDVNAEEKGAAVAEVVNHEAKTDPHAQYFNQTRGDLRYAQLTELAKSIGIGIGNALLPGSGITIAYNGDTNKTTISSVAGSGELSTFMVETRNNVTANQTFNYRFANQSAFNLLAFALKEEAGSKGLNVLGVQLTAASKDNFDQTPGMLFGSVTGPFVGGLLSLIPDGTNFSTVDVPSDAATLSYTMRNDIIPPAMTSANTPTGYTISASSEATSAFGNYLAWHAFNQLYPTTLPSDCWASAAAPTSAVPQWLRVDLPAPVILGSYVIRNRSVVATDQASPKTWIFQGSNDGGATWTNIHSVANNTNNTANALITNNLTQTVAYKSYRLYITDRNNTVSFCTVGELMLYAKTGLLIKANDDKWYKANAGELTEVAAPTTNDDFVANGFTASGTLTNSKVAPLLPFKLYSGTPIKVDSVVQPYQQIIIQKLFGDLSVYGKINSIAGTFTQTGAGKIRLAVRRDTGDWMIWNGSAWVAIGSLTSDSAGAAKLISQGMTPAVLTAITPTQWGVLFGGGDLDQLQWAVGFDVPAIGTDAATMTSLAYNLDETSSWKVQTPAEVEVRWRKTTVTFKALNAGNYKFGYQIP